MSEPLLVIRRVTGVDLRAASELLVHQQRARGHSVDEEQMRPALQAALEDEGTVLVLGAFHEGLPGFQHGKMVGVLMMTVMHSLEHAGEVGWIQELYVRQDYRKKGLGHRLLGQALGWSEGRGLRTLDVEVGAAGSEGHEPEAARRLYSSQGFRRIERARLSKRMGS